MKKEGYDPGAVKNGLQSQWIQPLVIRGNQGDCVKMTLRNQLEGGEDVSLNMPTAPAWWWHLPGSLRRRRIPTASRRRESVELEWYIPPTQQEGGRQFHSYSHDRELPVMGLFGTFCDRAKGSNVWIRSAQASQSR